MGGPPRRDRPAHLAEPQVQPELRRSPSVTRRRHYPAQVRRAGNPADPVVDAITFCCPSRVSRRFRAARHLIRINALHKN